MSGNRPLNSALNAITSHDPAAIFDARRFVNSEQITPSEPGGACLSTLKARVIVAKTGDWQAGTREKQDEEEAQKEKG